MNTKTKECGNCKRIINTNNDKYVYFSDKEICCDKICLQFRSISFVIAETLRQRQKRDSEDTTLENLKPGIPANHE